MPEAAKTDAFASLVRRLGRWIALAALLAAPAVAWQWGLPSAAGFSFGALAAFFNMRWLAAALARPSAPSTVLLVLRFALIGGAAYVILETFGISPLFVIAGLLTASVAAVLEILFQLFYART
jgi:hypothetical protein